MFIDISEEGGVRVLKIEGEIRTDDARVLGETFEKVLEEGEIDCVLDLGGVHYVTSAGLGHIVSAAAVLRRRGGNLAVANLTADVRKAFEVTRIDKVVEVAASVGAAAQKLRALSG